MRFFWNLNETSRIREIQFDCWFLEFIIKFVLAQVKRYCDEKFSYSSPCRQGKIYWNFVLAEPLLVTRTHLLLGEKFWIYTTSRELRFCVLNSRTHFFLMTHTLRKPVSNLNTFLISGEVFSDLWLQATGSLLKKHPNEHVQKIIANRTQTRIPSFELAIRICKMFWFVWAYLTWSEYDIQTSRIVQIYLFPFWHMDDFPS